MKKTEANEHQNLENKTQPKHHTVNVLCAINDNSASQQPNVKIVTSSTGLIASVRNPARRKRYIERKRSLDTQSLVTKAPVALKPFAGLYNPFPYGCSILCNHPADCEAKDVVRRAKESWIHESKASALPSDEYLAMSHDDCRGLAMSPEVPEELFRKYTDTDSRPLTPCVTVASAVTRGSLGSRRCVTPDPPAQKTLLVLDLRRSHSQETLACCLPGMLSSQGGLTCSPTPPDTTPSPKPGPKKNTATQPGGGNAKAKASNDTNKPSVNQEDKAKELSAEDEEEMIRRRGKKKKKKSKAEEAKDLEKEFKGLAEPGETLRRIALQEALRIMEPKMVSEELKRLHVTLSQTKTDSESWLTLPRTFTRRSARFELPLDSRLLTDMTPLEYLEDYVWISPGRRLLYNRVFNRHLVRAGKRLMRWHFWNKEAHMRGKDIISGLGEVMGRQLTEIEASEYQSLLDWRPETKVRFKLWCGVCALFERIYAKNFCTEFLSKEADPCNAVENADFETLHKKLIDNKPNDKLVTVLNQIKTL
ncbi:uncharacterized protein LOC103511767 [Diaphorina citri]|uniref:Uncharacterized protein LOC103511767 n=1 Tax=Diaphorina citri TaxID=121845 RepID=A0A3Q0IYA7_DIACI|nr:uncharacterized protein LOC103511767 [Diaphorina citri]